MSNPSSQDVYGYASNQNLRALMHPGQGPGSLVRSSTAARIEDFHIAGRIPEHGRASLEIPGRGPMEGSYPAGDPRQRLSQQRMRKSLTVFPRVGSDSRIATSLRKGQSSGKQDEFSVAEISAQVMLDQNEGVTEASQQLNASFPGNGKLLASLGSPGGQSRQNSNIVTVENVQRGSIEHLGQVAFGYPQIQENHFRTIDLEQVFLEAVKLLEQRERKKINESQRKGLMHYIKKNAGSILRQ